MPGTAVEQTVDGNHAAPAPRMPTRWPARATGRMDGQRPPAAKRLQLGQHRLKQGGIAAARRGVEQRVNGAARGAELVHAAEVPAPVPVGLYSADRSTGAAAAPPSSPSTIAVFTTSR